MTSGSDEFLEKALSAAFAPIDGLAPRAVERAPRPPAPTSLPTQIGRYPVEAVIGRGGTGLVLRARDMELQRAIAVKVLHKHLADDPEMVHRFVEEARVAGSLQHPGVVPIHEMGRTADGRPYFTMKLVEGDTLAVALAARTSPADDRLGFVTIMEKICQIVAYAHAHEVVHQDLKPANIMVSAYGETLVTDWGFADELGPERARPADASREPAITRARIVGTPAYMSPEKATGRGGPCDRRSDVFALGAILCEILTGNPPYTEDTASGNLLAASRGWLDDAGRRLAACGADADLLTLTERCLAPRPEDRPGDAGEVAAAISRHLRTLDARVHASAIEAASATARADAERRQGRVILASAAVVVLAIAVGSAAWLWSDHQSAVRSREDERVAVQMGERAALLAEHARRAGTPEPAQWEEPVAVVREAAEFAAERNLPADLQQRLAQLGERTELERGRAQHDRRLIDDLVAIREHFGDLRDVGAKNTDYAAVFRREGLDPTAGDPADVAARVAASSQREELLQAMDDWIHSQTAASQTTSRTALVTVANRADSDPWRVRVRAAAAARDLPTLRELANSPACAAASVQSQMLLAHALRGCGLSDDAVTLLEAAAAAHPDRYAVHHALAIARRDGPPGGITEAIRHFSMALALRPASAHALVDLGQAFLQAGDLTAGERLMREAQRVDPRYAPAVHYLGGIAQVRGDLPGAETLLREALALDPGSAISYMSLGIAQRQMRRLPDAEGSFRAAVGAEPSMADAWCGLGEVQLDRGEFAAAVESLTTAGELGRKQARPWAASAEDLLAEARDMVDAAAELGPPGAQPLSVDGMTADHMDVLARAAAHLGRYAEAYRLCCAIVDTSPRAALKMFPFSLFAARIAAAAGTGQGTPPLDGAAAAGARQHALAWLQAALAAATVSTDGAAARGGNLAELSKAMASGEMSGVRDADGLRRLPADESAAWAGTWDRVRALSRTATRPASRPSMQENPKAGR